MVMHLVIPDAPRPDDDAPDERPVPWPPSGAQPLHR